MWRLVSSSLLNAWLFPRAISTSLFLSLTLPLPATPQFGLHTRLSKPRNMGRLAETPTRFLV